MMRERIRSLVGNPQDPENAETAARVYVDGSLWPEMENALYPDAVPTDEELRTIRRVVAEHCDSAEARREKALRDFVKSRLERISWGMEDFALAASRRAATENGDAKDEAGEPVTFVFVSDASLSIGDGRFPWRASMTLPPNAEVDEMLPIEVTDGHGDFVESGVFKIAGVALPVSGGHAEIPYGMFLSGLKDAQVELVSEKGVRSPGTLALF